MRHRFSIAVAVFLTGCYPVALSFLRVEAPSAKYVGDSCFGSAGLHSVAYFPYHGIFLSLGLEDWVRLGLHIPAGTTVQLLEREVRIVGETKRGSVDLSLPMTPKGRGALGSVHPREFGAFPEVDIGPEDYGPFVGASTADDRHVWKLFLAMEEDARRLRGLPPGIVSGTVELPAMLINGQRHKAVFPFQRKRELSIYLYCQ